MNEQKGYSELFSKRVMKEVERNGIDLRPSEERIDLPLVGEKFLIERNECEVIYINIGRLRFTCKCSEELPLIGSTFMFKGTEYSVTHLDTKKKKFTFELYRGDTSKQSQEDLNEG